MHTFSHFERILNKSGIILHYQNIQQSVIQLYIIEL
jgi:hypothetical protein